MTKRESSVLKGRRKLNIGIVIRDEAADHDRGPP